MIMFGFFHRKQPANNNIRHRHSPLGVMRSLGFQPADSDDGIHSKFPTNNKFTSLNIFVRDF